MNVFFGIGAFSGPILGSILLASYRSWNAPMIAFGLAGYVMIAAITLTVRPWWRRLAPRGLSKAVSPFEVPTNYLTILNFCTLRPISVSAI